MIDKCERPCPFVGLTVDQITQLETAVKDFEGQLGVLESAVGALVVGHKFGWRVLQIAHSQATLKKYEKILGLKFKDVCPERTELSKKSIGLRIADKLKSFWAVALGKTPVANKDCLDSG